jgi:hypothetical protein
MSANLVEWTVRMVMLVLAGLVTLSILGSIAAMSNGAGGGPDPAAGARPVLDGPPQPAPAPQPETVPAGPPPAEPEPDLPGATPDAGTIAVAAPQPERDGGPERWLEAIAYALLALAGLGAIGLVLLWRGLRRLDRIAQALEARPRH